MRERGSARREEELRQARSRLDASVLALGRHVRDGFFRSKAVAAAARVPGAWEWVRGGIDRRPFAAVAGALILGAMLGASAGPRR